MNSYIALRKSRGQPSYIFYRSPKRGSYITNRSCIYENKPSIKALLDLHRTMDVFETQALGTELIWNLYQAGLHEAVTLN